MCTLTYVPLENGAVITANRDESPLRKATGLVLHETKSAKTFYIAKEPIHGGTNMAIGKSGAVAVLLNGAFYPHAYNPPYSLSRGLLLLESLECEKLQTFASDFDFSGIE
ncbi:MAG TPA: NRDE family protein, partial [Cryomorphaceae bacterium]|nr:NRDE family protein [Cryomorphaceae bacterium]